MLLTKSIISSLPFPYFYIDKYNTINYQSNKAKDLFPSFDNFIDIVSPNFKLKATEFLLRNCQQTYLKIPLLNKNNFIELFYIFKLYSEETDKTHLFCFNVDEDERLLKSEVHEETTSFNTGNNVINHIISNEKQLQTVVTSIAHEIRNPLTTVKGFMQLLKPHLDNTGKVDYVDIAIDEINRANNIVLKYLKRSKEESEEKTVSLEKLLNDIELTYKSEAIIHNLTLTVEPVEKNVIVLIDENQIKQVIANIIRNAVESINENEEVMIGKIYIYTELINSYVYINIQDNGGGIQEDVIANLFQPFYTTKDGGTGIGLTICREIIEANGGQLIVSTTIGDGTTFKIMLPFYKFI